MFSNLPADFLLLHADSAVQESQSGEHGGLHTDGGFWLPVALHRADEGLPSVAGLASVPAVTQRLLHWDCTGEHPRHRGADGDKVSLVLSTELICVSWTCQVVYLEAQGDGAVFSSLTSGPHPLYVSLVMLVLDCILYLLLAIYLDQVLPGENNPFSLHLLSKETKITIFFSPTNMKVSLE